LLADNAGSAGTGRRRLTGSLDVDNLFGFYDTLGTAFVTSADTNALTFSGSVPAGYWTWNSSWSYSEYLSVISPEVDLYGYSRTATLGTEYMLHRDGRKKLRLTGGLTRRLSERFLNSTALTPQRATVAKLGLQGDFYPPGWILGGDIGYAQGLRRWSSDRDPADILRGEPHAQFRKVTAGLSATTSFADGLTWRLSLQGQLSPTGLYGTEQISIGDRDTVRGFEEDGIGGDSGWYARNDLIVPLGWFLPGVTLPGPAARSSLTLGLDGGRVWSIADDDHYSRCGASLGVSVPGDFGTLSLTYAAPLCGTHPNDHGAVYLSLSLKMF
jgi:hemolysin activation/secretion protein